MLDLEENGKFYNDLEFRVEGDGLKKNWKILPSTPDKVNVVFNNLTDGNVAVSLKCLAGTSTEMRSQEIVLGPHQSYTGQISRNYTDQEKSSLAWRLQYDVVRETGKLPAPEQINAALSARMSKISCVVSLRHKPVPANFGFKKGFVRYEVDENGALQCKSMEARGIVEKGFAGRHLGKDQFLSIEYGNKEVASMPPQCSVKPIGGLPSKLYAKIKNETNNPMSAKVSVVNTALKNAGLILMKYAEQINVEVPPNSTVDVTHEMVQKQSNAHWNKTFARTLETDTPVDVIVETEEYTSSLANPET